MLFVYGWVWHGCDTRTYAPNRRARYIDVDEVIESIFSSPTGELPYPVTLPQMIDLLVDLWEADGLFD